MKYTKEALRQQVNVIIKSNILKAEEGEILGASGNIVEIPIISACSVMYEALKLAVEKLRNEGRVYENTIWICEKALAKVDGKT